MNPCRVFVYEGNDKMTVVAAVILLVIAAAVVSTLWRCARAARELRDK